jgi:hypothetical protein
MWRSLSADWWRASRYYAVAGAVSLKSDLQADSVSVFLIAVGDLGVADALAELACLHVAVRCVAVIQLVTARNRRHIRYGLSGRCRLAARLPASQS